MTTASAALCLDAYPREVIKVIFRKKMEYMDWESYQRKVSFIEVFAWQQRIRRQSIRNLACK